MLVIAYMRLESNIERDIEYKYNAIRKSLESAFEGSYMRRDRYSYYSKLFADVVIDHILDR